MPITSCLRALQTVVTDSRLHHEPAPAINIVVLFLWHHSTDLLMLSCRVLILFSFSQLAFSVSLCTLQDKLLSGDAEGAILYADDITIFSVGCG